MCEETNQDIFSWLQLIALLIFYVYTSTYITLVKYKKYIYTIYNIHINDRTYINNRIFYNVDAIINRHSNYWNK